jgi:excisionase family DNA binding protein
MVDERDDQPVDATDEVIEDQETNGHAAGEPRLPLDRTRYLSTKEAAELLGVNRATVINWARQGKFGGFQYGVRGIYRFDRQELIDFIGRSRIPYPHDAASLDKDAGATG